MGDHRRALKYYRHSTKI